MPQPTVCRTTASAGVWALRGEGSAQPVPGQALGFLPLTKRGPAVVASPRRGGQKCPQPLHQSGVPVRAVSLQLPAFLSYRSPSLVLPRPGARKATRGSVVARTRRARACASSRRRVTANPTPPWPWCTGRRSHPARASPHHLSSLLKVAFVKRHSCGASPPEPGSRGDTVARRGPPRPEAGAHRRQEGEGLSKHS